MCEDASRTAAHEYAWLEKVAITIVVHTGKFGIRNLHHCSFGLGTTIVCNHSVDLTGSYRAF